MYQFLSKHGLLIALTWLVLMFAIFYPPRSVTIDEHDYLQNASLILHQDLRQKCDGSASQFAVGNYCISKYNIGASLFLIPAALTTPEVGYAIVFITFAIGIIVFYRMLKLLRLSTIFVFLYALFPAFVYYSRTMLSETFSATLIMIVVYCLWQEQISPKLKWGFLAGGFAGLAVLVRYTNVIPLVLLFALLYLPSLLHKTFKEIVIQIAGVLAGGLPWVIVLLMLNVYLYGAPLRSGYYYSGEEGVFILSQVPLFIAHFAIGLSLIYPAMLELPAIIRTRVSLLLIPVAAVIIFYSGFPSAPLQGRPLDLILGLRFIVPVVPLMLIAYSASLHKFEDRKWFKVGMVLTIVGLLALSLLLSYQHQQFLINYQPS